MKTRIATGVLVLMMAGGLGACGDDDDAASSDITKEEFIAQGDAICTKANEEIDAIPEPETEEATYEAISNDIVPRIRQQVQDVRDLGFPADDADMLDQLLDDVEARLDEIADDPESVLNSEEDPFAGLNEQLADYGFEVCSQ